MTPITTPKAISNSEDSTSIIENGFNRRKKRRFLQNSSIGTGLLERETGMPASNTQHQRDHEFYLHITPNDTVFNIQSLDGAVPKRFSPNGELLIAYSCGTQTIHFYHFNGPCLERNILLQDVKDNLDIYGLFFKPLRKIQLTPHNYEYIMKEFCLFSEDTRFMMSVTVSPPSKSGDIEPRFPNTFGEVKGLKTYCLYVICVESGQITDKIRFEDDLIRFENHAGISVRGQKLAITSIRDQTIYIYRLTDTGKLAHVCTIGWFNRSKDEMAVALQYGEERRYLSEKLDQSYVNTDYEVNGKKRKREPTRDEMPKPDESFSACDRRLGLDEMVMSDEAINRPKKHHLAGEEPAKGAKPLSGIHQRILSYLFQVARDQPHSMALSNFYYMFPLFSEMLLCKAQFVDESHLHIRFCSEAALRAKDQNDPDAQMFFLVVYNIETTQVIGVYDSTSKECQEIIQDSFDELCGPTYDFPIQLSCTLSNNQFVRNLHFKKQYTFRSARNGGETHATKRFLSTIPISPQSIGDSPFHDWTLFNHDEKTVWPQERPLQDYPVKFFDQKTGCVRFTLHLSHPTQKQPMIPRRYASFIFHPTMPFVMAVQQPAKHTTSQQPTINCYFRRSEPRPVANKS